MIAQYLARIDPSRGEVLTALIVMLCLIALIFGILLAFGIGKAAKWADEEAPKSTDEPKGDNQ